MQAHPVITSTSGVVAAGTLAADGPKWAGYRAKSTRIVDSGKISEAQFLSDFHGPLTQLGATTSLPGPPGHVRP